MQLSLKFPSIYLFWSTNTFYFRLGVPGIQVRIAAVVLGAGAMVNERQPALGFIAAAQVVAVRVMRPISLYARYGRTDRSAEISAVCVGGNPERLVVDLEGVNLNSVLKGMGAEYSR